MPINSNRHPQRLSLSGATQSAYGLANTTSFLFDEDEDRHLSLNAMDLTSPVAKAFAQLEGDNTFPTLTSDGLKVRTSDLSARPACLLTYFYHHSFLPIRPLLTLPTQEPPIWTGHSDLDIDHLIRACLRQIHPCTDLF